ncbi:hypothetical protein KJ870_05335 [bacterium]|nr:hypothetical protein [bacterium]MBU1434341.1 hypothetical protein [bacterium]MBU1503732.1 hypothetical protein [bacterium]
MSKSNKIIPEFMLDSPNDTFMFLMPLSLKPDDEDLGNSYFEVAVKNITKNEHFTTLISPEVFFTHFKLYKAYKSAKLDKKANKYIKTEKQTCRIDTKLFKEQYDTTLGKCLDKNQIGQLLGYKYTYITEAQNTSCCLVKTWNEVNLIIPHSVIAIYYYYRSTVLREATLRCDLNNLYYGYDCDPSDASIIIPKYVPETDAPFIHRFLCHNDAVENFEKIGTYINAYMRRKKDMKHIQIIESVPIKAKFPVEDEFSMTFMASDFYHEGKYYKYVHEILDDNSDIGFSKFTTFLQGKNIITEVDDIDKLPTIPVTEPSETSERLKSTHATKRYKQNTITSNRKNKCSSLANVEISTDKITDEEALEKLKIMEETLSNEKVDQSLTDSSGNGEKKTRKTRVSSKGQEFQKMSTTEYIHNFDEFNKYIEYMRTQKAIENLEVYENQKMTIVYNGENGNANPKCTMYGRERQYITATFKYKNSYVGLLELENIAATSTWVVSSKKPIDNSVFMGFLHHYIDDNMSIDGIRKKYDGSANIKFKTKNHERESELTQVIFVKWVTGVLGKITV